MMPLMGRYPTPIQVPRTPMFSAPAPSPMQPAPPGGGGGGPSRTPMPLRGANPMRPVLGTMHKGGPIKKSGLYNMQKGEQVIPAKKVKQLKRKMVSIGALAS